MWRIFETIKYYLEMTGIILMMIFGILIIFSPLILIVLVIYYLIFQPELVGKFIGNWLNKFGQGLK